MLSAEKAREIAKAAKKPKTPVEEVEREIISNAVRKMDSCLIKISDPNVYEKICEKLEEAEYKLYKPSNNTLVVIWDSFDK